jgi:hypothetical protein
MGARRCQFSFDRARAFQPHLSSRHQSSTMEASIPTGESQQAAGSAAKETPSRFRMPFRGRGPHKIGGEPQVQLAHRGYFNRK